MTTPQDAAEDADVPSERVARRLFLRSVSREAIGLAATLAGASSAIGSAALRAMPVGLAAPVTPVAEPPAHDPPMQDPAGGGYRRDPSGSLLVADRTAGSGHVWRPCPDGSALARMLARHEVGSGPILAPLAAWALEGTARASATMDDDGRRNVLRATAALLRRARPASMALAATLDDCAAAWVDEPSADACARSLEAIASASAALARGATGSVAAHASHVLRTLPAGDVVLHGASSEQAGGELGLAAALAQGLGTKSGRSFLVAASSPTGEGTAVRDDLLRAGVRTSLIADAAVASVMASGAVAVALVAAEWVGADGSIVAPAGALGLAALAAYRQVPLLVLDASGVSPRPLPTLPPPRPDSLARPTHDAPPLMDVVPPELVTALVRMEGIA